MKRLTHKFVLYWIVAAAAHLPIPVCDGDNVGSESHDHSFHLLDLAGRSGDAFDIDVVFLGCDEPDDPDDGPVDDDPEGEDSAPGAFPVYLPSKIVKGSWRKAKFTQISQLSGGLVHNARGFLDRVEIVGLSFTADRNTCSRADADLIAPTVMLC